MKFIMFLVVLLAHIQYKKPTTLAIEDTVQRITRNIVLIADTSIVQKDTLSGLTARLEITIDVLLVEQ